MKRRLKWHFTDRPGGAARHALNGHASVTVLPKLAMLVSSNCRGSLFDYLHVDIADGCQCPEP